MKKKLLALLLAGAMLTAAGAFGFAGCGANEADDDNKDQIETPDNTPSDGETDDKKPSDSNSDTDKEQEKPHSHVFDKKVAENKYLKSEATCTAKAVYYLSCECGEKGEQTFESGAALGHSFTGSQRYNEHSHYQLCERCNLTITAAHEMNDKTCGVCGFHKTEGLATAPVDGGICIMGIGDVTDEQIFVPSLIDGVSVTAVASESFRDNETITRIVVPDTVTSIGAHAFSGCKNLKEFWVYETEPAAKAKTFSAVSRVNDSNPTETATEIGADAFADCKNLTEIEIPEGVTEIGDRAFFNCIELTSVKIPDGLTTIGAYAFSTCLNLVELILPDSVENLGDQAFVFCLSLKSLTIPASVKKIHGTPSGPIFVDAYGLSISYNLESIYIPKTVNKIERGAFTGFGFLIYCEAESKPESWDDEWNDACPVIWDYKNNNKDENGYEYAYIKDIRYALKDGQARIVRQKLYLGGEVKLNLDDTGYFNAEYISNNEPIVIPKKVIYKEVEYSVTSIDDSALAVSGALKEMVLPEGLTDIGDYAFNGCEALTNITLPESLIKIGIEAFWQCRALETITFKGTKEQWLNIEKGDDWNVEYNGSDSTPLPFIVHCSDGKLDSRGNEIS